MYEIRTLGDPVLRETCHDVTSFDAGLQRLAKEMLEIMDEAEGIGLAASQIGVLKRLIVCRDPDTDEAFSFVNPAIVERSQAECLGSEGCLSVPGFSVEVPRAEWVVMEACDVKGRPLRVEAKDTFARVLQHEIDHLEGHLILDRTSAEERRRVLKAMRDRKLGS